jgi:hypothetical protein
MRLGFVAAAALALLGGCNLFGGTTDPPTGFQGWFHLDRPGRATSLLFDSSNLAVVRDLGCDGVRNGETPWTVDGDALVLPEWTTPAPRFVQDPSTSGALIANPGMYGTTQEQWLPGATCVVCPAGDAGVAVACGDPVVRDGGT